MKRESEFLSGIPRLKLKNGIAVGDDAALLPEGLLASVDTLVDGRHFVLSEVNYTDLAIKLIAVNLSDMAAMGGQGAYLLLSLTCGPGFDADAFMKAFLKEAEAQHLILLGGDTVSGNQTVLSLTILGHPSVVIAQRHMAQEGDVIFVTGTLGGAVKSGRHLRPQPRLAEGQYLVNQGVGCLMDLSDGLAQGLFCLATESQKQFVVRQKDIPVHGDAEDVNAAFYEGEDFELLGTAAAALWPTLKKSDFAFTCIGEVVAGGGVFLELERGERKPLPPGGYEHKW